MCTVSYVPVKNGFILTSNRDEQIERNKFQKPSYSSLGEKKILAPKDKLKKGTWIATDGSEFSLCLFNGGYEKHKLQPAYKESRGNIIPNFFSYNDVIHFVTAYNFYDIEPFSLIIAMHQSEKLWLFIWDGENTNLHRLDYNKQYLWSSVTLYNPEIHKRKENAFRKNLKNNKKLDIKEIVKLHKTTEIGEIENNFIMHRKDGLQTLSITSIEVNNENTTLYHENLLNNHTSFITFGENSHL